MRITALRLLIFFLSFHLAPPPAATAVDSPVLGKKLIIIDRTPVNGRSKATYIARHVGVDKGAAGDPALLSGSFEIFYVDDPANGSIFDLPLGDWDKNTDRVGRYRNRAAPVGGEVKVVLVKPLKVAKVVAKDKGAIDISSPPTAAGIITMLTVDNGNDGSQTRMCTLFSVEAGSRVKHRALAGGLAGYKLTLRDGVGVACPAACSDGVQNGDETDVDCGGGTCDPCDPGLDCNVNTDCASLICQNGVCTPPSCADSVQNQDETSVDCGGSICDPCTLSPSCSDGIQNQGETGVDCGGSCPDSCIAGEDCNTDADCETGVCSNGVCTCGVGYRIFYHDSTVGNLVTPAVWQGGTQTHTFFTNCSVTIRNPTQRIDIVGTAGDSFLVSDFSGFTTCFGTGGDDDLGCEVVSGCHGNVGGFCEAARPSCPDAIDTRARAGFKVVCQ